MPVLIAAYGTNDWSARLAITFDHSANRRGADQRHIDQRHKRRHDSRAIDDAQAGEKRRQLTLVVQRILDEPRGEVDGSERRDDRFGLMANHDDDVFNRRRRKRANDAREKRVAAVERERRLGPSHAARLSSSEHNRRNHAGIV